MERETETPPMTATEMVAAEAEMQRRWEVFAGDAIAPAVAATIGVLAKYDPLAAARALLHGQPFGFTPADVELLRLAAADHEWVDGINARKEARELLALADRIEALLPPG